MSFSALEEWVEASQPTDKEEGEEELENARGAHLGPVHIVKNLHSAPANNSQQQIHEQVYDVRLPTLKQFGGRKRPGT